MKSCKICSQPLFNESLLKFENMPSVAQNFPDSNTVHQDRGINIELYQCSACRLVQLDTQPVPYFRDVIRSSSISKEMHEFRIKQFSDFIRKHSLTKKKIIEIGCGRGEYLEILKNSGGNAFGIENSKLSVETCKNLGLNVYHGYIEGPDFKIPNGPYDSFFIMNFLEHIPDVRSFLRGILKNISDDGVGLIEVPNFDMILRDQLFCEIMTDHLYYFTKETLRTTLSLNGFEVLECSEIWHAYILSAVVKKSSKANLVSFHNYQNKLKAEFSSYLKNFPQMSVAVWGAGHQSLAILSIAKLEGKIKYVVDSAHFKQGKYTPATHLPIVSPDILINDNNLEAIIVIGASYSDEIVRTLKTKHRKNLSIAVFRPEGLEIISNSI